MAAKILPPKMSQKDVLSALRNDSMVPSATDRAKRGNVVVAIVMPIRLTGTLSKFLAKLRMATEPGSRWEATMVKAQKVASSTGWPNIFGNIRESVFLNSGRFG